MFCKNCGHEIEPGATYCAQCGKKLEAKQSFSGIRRWFIPFIAVCAIGLGLLIGYLAIGKEPAEESVKNVQTTSTPTTPTKHVHTWQDATYSSPKICTTCGATEGTPLRDPTDNILMEDPLSSFLEHREDKGAIGEIRFLDSMENAPAGCWDVSQAKDNSVLAWTEPTKYDNTYTLVIAADGGVYAPEDCSYMFSCGSVYEISFNGAFHTENARTMEGMFSGCGNLQVADWNALDTSNVENMSKMFEWTNFQELDLSSFDTSSVVDMSEMFSRCMYTKSLDLHSWDTGNVTNMSSMFGMCQWLLNLDIRGWDTSRVTDMGHMFAYCCSLPELDVSDMDTSSATNMDSMFLRCSSVMELDLSGFDTSKVTNMAYMFKECASLKRLDVSSFDTSNVTDMTCMFQLCDSLTTLDIENFDMSKVEDDVGMLDYETLTDLRLPASFA